MNNTTATGHVETKQYLLIIKIVFLCAISLVGITGNVMICTTLIPRKRKSSEYFIINLALADLTVCAVGIPLDIYEQLHDTWQYGTLLCKIIYPSQTLLVLVSIMTLTAMSLERYRAIMTPLKPSIKKPALLKVIALVWIIGLSIIAPYANILTHDGKKCEEHWHGVRAGAYYTLALFIIDYCIPLTIITYCYTRAGFELYKNTKQFKDVTDGQTSSTFQDIAQRKRLRRNTHIIKLFSFAVLIFVVCMLPGDCFWMWKSFGHGSTFAYEHHFQTFSNILLYANSAINPFIFGACKMGCLRVRCKHSLHADNSRVSRFSSGSSSRRLIANHNQDCNGNNLRHLRDDDTWRRSAKRSNFHEIEKLRETDV